MMGLQKRLQRYFKLQQEGFDFNEEIREVKAQMSVLAEIKAKGVLIRSKEREIEEGEKCTRYFFKKIINGGEGILKLKKGNGEYTKTQEEIMTQIECFYGELYNRKNIEEGPLEKILNALEKKIADDAFLTRDFNLLELFKCLSSFKRGKSPGDDEPTIVSNVSLVLKK